MGKYKARNDSYAGLGFLAEIAVKIKLTAWIDENYPDKKSCENQCHVAVRSMARCFPKLSVQVGYANSRFHCWLKDMNGSIIDPTAKQFDGEINYRFVVDRFLHRGEVEVSTGIIFLKDGRTFTPGDTL